MPCVTLRTSLAAAASPACHLPGGTGRAMLLQRFLIHSRDVLPCPWALMLEEDPELSVFSVLGRNWN